MGYNDMTRQPSVFLRTDGDVEIGLVLSYWLDSMGRRHRIVALPEAVVVLRATRPDYSAGFGTPPPTSAVAPDPSAWPEQPPQAPPAPAEQPPASEPQLPAAEWGPPTEWGTGVPDGGYPELSTPEEPGDRPAA